MEKYIPPKNRTEAQVRAELAEDFARWDHIKEHGCSDPNWADGFNMNLVRGHIINGYRLLAEKVAENCQLSLFSCLDIRNERPVPPLMPDEWMCPTGQYPDRLSRKKGART